MIEEFLFGRQSKTIIHKHPSCMLIVGKVAFGIQSALGKIVQKRFKYAWHIDIYVLAMCAAKMIKGALWTPFLRF